MKVITFCPTFRRPKQCATMLESFFKTKTIAEIWVHLCDDDPMLKEYEQVLVGVPHEIGTHKYICQVYNYGALVKFPGYDCYHDANDDHVFITTGWDKIMAECLAKHNFVGTAYGVTKNLPTAIMTGGKQIRALGYWFPPDFQHHSCDLFVETLGKGTDTLYYLPEVEIEHRHRLYGLANDDDNYKFVYSINQTTIGLQAYEAWRTTRMMRDIRTLNEIKG